MAGRLERALDALENLNLDCGILFKPENIYYLTDYYPTARAALILRDAPLLVVSKMDAHLAEASEVEFKAAEKINKELPLGVKRIGVEKNYLSLEFYERHLKGKEVYNLGFIDEMRSRKDRGEIARIKKAAQITSRVIKEASEGRIGKEERELAAQVEYMIKKRAELAFNAIVAAGENSAIPHHTPGARRILWDDVVILDIGARVEHYNADLTRTILPEREDEIYEAALEAQKAGIKECYAGNEVKKADLAVRRVLREYGYEKFFLHSTGHGVGLEIHELPRLTKEAEGRFEEGMVVTVEPGIYREYGVRIEDLVLVTKKPVLLSNRGF
jgi:Xaa-Pro dipeptidase